MDLLCSGCKVTKDETEFHKAGGRYPHRNNRAYLCKPCKVIKSRTYQQENYEWWRKYRSDYTRQKRAFFEVGEYDRKFEEQNYCCAICGATESGGKGAFHADHDHETETPRGILCFHCNSALGFFKDNVDFLQSAIEYLNKYK